MISADTFAGLERKDAAARQAMVEALEERIRSNAKGLAGNRGYALYLKFSKGAMINDREKLQKRPDLTASGCCGPT